VITDKLIKFFTVNRSHPKCFPSFMIINFLFKLICNLLITKVECNANFKKIGHPDPGCWFDTDHIIKIKLKSKISNKNKISAPALAKAVQASEPNRVPSDPSGPQRACLDFLSSEEFALERFQASDRSASYKFQIESAVYSLRCRDLWVCSEKKIQINVLFKNFQVKCIWLRDFLN
jgi:hypothetical protein